MSEGECLHYEKGKANIVVNFPDGHVACNYCPFCKYEMSYDRYRCILNDEYLFNVKKQIGFTCPLNFEEE